MSFVLDASVVLAWGLDEADAERTRSIRESLRVRPALVPSLWWLEVANALMVAERRGRITRERVDRFATAISSLPLRTDTGAAERALGEIARLAHAHRISVYDAVYVELALRERVGLATLDEPLRIAAEAAGVEVLE